MVPWDEVPACTQCHKEQKVVSQGWHSPAHAWEEILHILTCERVKRKITSVGHWMVTSWKRKKAQIVNCGQFLSSCTFVYVHVSRKTLNSTITTDHLSYQGSVKDIVSACDGKNSLFSLFKPEKPKDMWFVTKVKHMMVSFHWNCRLLFLIVLSDKNITQKHSSTKAWPDSALCAVTAILTRLPVITSNAIVCLLWRAGSIKPPFSCVQWLFGRAVVHCWTDWLFECAVVHAGLEITGSTDGHGRWTLTDCRGALA